MRPPSVCLFGKTDADIDKIIADRSADFTLAVPSPITGRITSRNAAPGLFVQPGNAPAPYTVTDVNLMWMLARRRDRQPGLPNRATCADLECVSGPCV